MAAFLDGFLTRLRSIVVAAVSVAVMVVAAAGTVGADPTAPPGPGHQIPGPDGPTFPGTQTYLPRCARNMLACGFRYDPGTGTWNPSGLGDE